MYCKFYDEEYDDCSSCDRTYSCEQRKQMKKEDQEAITLSIKESELFKKSTALLSGFFNLSEEEINKLSFDLFNRSLNVFEQELKSSFKIMAKEAANEYIATKCKAFLDECFTKSLGEEITMINDENNFTTKKIQEITMNAISKFIKDKSSYNGRRTTDETIDKAIKSVVAEKVEKALKELKTEAIDKFNKEAMKAMMRGMAKTLGEDKKLLSVLALD